MIDISILGPLTVVTDDGTQEVTAPRVRRLLTLLAIEAGDVVSIERITEVLWGEDPPDSFRSTIQTYVSHLRRVLGSDALERVSQGYRLRGVTCDRAAWWQDLEAARASEDPREVTAHTVRLLGRWRGDPVADLGDSVYATATRAALEEARCEAVERMIEAQMVLGRGGESLPELERIRHEHPYREHLVELRMLILYREGRQADALAAFGEFRSLLVDDLGVEPSAHLYDVEARILRQDPELDQDPGTPQVQAPAPVSLPRPPRNLVGREEVTAAVEWAAARAAEGDPHLVQIRGEPGSGKTTALVDAVRRLTEAGFTVVEGHCRRSRAGTEPFGCLIDAFSKLALDAPATVAEAFEQVAPHWLEEIPTAGPSRDREPTPPPVGMSSTTVIATSTRMLREGIAAITQLCAAGPVALVLDDGDWIDDNSLDLLDALLAQRDLPVLIAIATSLEDLDGLDRHPLRTRPNVVDVVLHPLSRAEVGAHLGGSAISDQLLDLVMAESGGIPLLVEELMAELHHREVLVDSGGNIDLTGAPSSALPSTLAVFARGRIGRLDRSQREVLEVGAIEGTTFAAGAVACVLDLPQPAVEALLDAIARQHGIIERHAPSLWPDGRVSPEFAFRYESVRDQLYDSIAEPKREQLHLAVARCVRDAFAPDLDQVAGLLVHHFAAGGDPRSSAEFGVLAGELALKRNAYRDAIARFTSALGHLEGLERDTGANEFELRAYAGLGRAMVHDLGAVDQQAVAVLESGLVAAARSPRVTDHEVDVRCSLALLAGHRYDIAEGLRVLAPVLDPAITGEPVIAAHEIAAGLMIIAHDFSGGVRHAELVLSHLRLPDALDDLDDEVRRIAAAAAAWHALGSWYSGDADASLRYARDSVRYAEVNAQSLVSAETHLASVHWLRNEPEPCRIWAERARLLAETEGFDRYALACQVLEAWGQTASGEVEGGLDAMGAAFEHVDPARFASTLAFLINAHADALIRGDRFEEADEMLEVLVGRPEQAWNRGACSEAWRLRAVALARSGGDGDLVDDALSKSTELAAGCNSPPLLLRTATTRLELDAGAGGAEASRQELRRLLGLFDGQADVPDTVAARQALEATDR